MCGIGGYVDPACALAGRDTLRTIARSLAHRGPDGEGFTQYGPFGLAHRRLAIIDLTATGEQPLIVDQVVLVFNGEIYNYRELRRELVAAGHSFAGNSDTEVLARAYLEWGVPFVKRLRGMWAFALLDKRSGSLLCSRDPFGIKPFYYAMHRGAFVFASEPQALITAGVPAKANLAIVAPYLALGICDHSSECFFAGIQQLEAGRTVVVDASARMKTAYSEDPYATAESGETSLEQFEQCLRESIGLHLRSDVPVGTCLSGGLDSSTVAALASQLNREASATRFAAVTAASGEADTDERQYAREVVDYCDLAWHIVHPDEQQFAGEIDECIRSQGEPAISPSIYFQYCVMKQARSAGVKVMLDGQGADELLCGYERYVPTFALEIIRHSGLVAGVRQFLQQSRNSRPGTRGMVNLALYLLLPFLRAWVTSSRVQFMREDLRATVLDLVRDLQPVYTRLRTARVADMSRFSLPALLRYEDRNSMAHSIEARVPYVDRELVGCALRLPESLILSDGFSKYPLRVIAARNLPASIAWRRSKIGFEPPSRKWLGAMGDRMQQAVEASEVVLRVCKKAPNLAELPLALRWRLYNLALWQRTFAVEAV